VTPPAVVTDVIDGLGWRGVGRRPRRGERELYDLRRDPYELQNGPATRRTRTSERASPGASTSSRTPEEASNNLLLSSKQAFARLAEARAAAAESRRS
jgi:hypothetical protein